MSRHGDRTQSPHPNRKRGRGFAAAGQLVAPNIRKATESRGVSLAQLISRWDHIVGADLSKLCYPVRMKSIQQRLAGTLQIRASAAIAPLISAQRQMIIDRVNAVFGYTAIDKISLEHAPTGFAEPRARFANKQSTAQPEPVSAISFDMPHSAELADELERLSRNIARRAIDETQSKNKGPQE